MGPFELSDLVGVDTGFDVSKSFYELSFGEPRWRPSPIQAQQRGRRPARAQERARLLRLLWRWAYRGRPIPTRRPVAAMQSSSATSPLAVALRPRVAEESGPRMDGRWARKAQSRRAFLRDGSAHPGRGNGPGGRERISGTGHAHRAGRPVPGGVLGRIVCQVINESAFALGEGVGSAQDIDTGMVLGMAHPRGPLAWAREIGVEHVLAVLEACGRSTARSATAPPRHCARPRASRRRSTASRQPLLRHDGPCSTAKIGHCRSRPSCAGAHCASARSPTGMPSGVGTSGVSRRYHSASSAAWQPEPAAVIAWR